MVDGLFFKLCIKKTIQFCQTIAGLKLQCIWYLSIYYTCSVKLRWVKQTLTEHCKNTFVNEKTINVFNNFVYLLFFLQILHVFRFRLICELRTFSNKGFALFVREIIIGYLGSTTIPMVSQNVFSDPFILGQVGGDVFLYCREGWKH